MADVGTELRAMASPEVRMDSTGISLKSAAGVQLRSRWKDLPLELKEGALGLFREALAGEGEESWHMTVLRLAAADPEFAEAQLPGDLREAKAFAKSWAASMDRTDPKDLRRQGLELVFEDADQMAPDAVDAHPELALAWRVFHEGLSQPSAPRALDLRDLALLRGATPAKVVQVRQCGGGLMLAPLGEVDPPGSFVVNMEIGSAEVVVAPVSNGSPEWSPRVGEPTRPDWADSIERDQYGVRVLVLVAEVEVWMRWIPPGEFLMGSPESEEGRWKDEGPQHSVTISKGFWLGETACTQALWRGVMGENPSNFRGDRRPVESVSHDRVMEFLGAIGEEGDAGGGSHFRLPSEAEWEYASRCGQPGPGVVETSELVGLAWFDENSERVTHPVGQLEPSRWGLVDMLGNVLEWCADDMRSFGPDAQVDPMGAIDKRAAALRGGSWSDSARDVRPAYRYAGRRGGRDSHVGFRLARGHSEPASKLAERSEAPGRGSAHGSRGTREPQRPATEREDESQWLTLAPNPGVAPAAVVPLLLRSDRMDAHFDVALKPAWATGIGRDEYGLWVTMGPESHPYRLRWMAPGRFTMGSEEGDELALDRERPRHQVTLSRGFWLGDTPCTQAMWEHVMGDNPSRWSGAKRPVDRVSHSMALELCEALNGPFRGEESEHFRLPTEAEWEYACRSGADEAALAKKEALAKVAWFGQDSGVGTSDVDLRDPNRWGLHDMLGNVFEWCADGRRTYGSGALEDPMGALGGASAALRGGGWNGSARYVRPACRGTAPRDERDSVVGFRLARGHRLKPASGGAADPARGARGPGPSQIEEERL